MVKESNRVNDEYPTINDWTWAYWQGDRSPLISVCLDSIARQNEPHSRILTPDDMPEEVKALSDDLGPHLTADVFRLWWVKTHGGQWLDADSLCINPCETYLALKEYDFVGYGFRQKPRHVSNGYFASRKEGIIINRIWDELIIRRKKGNKRWGGLGQQIFSKMYFEDKNANTKLFKRFEHWKVLSMSWRNQKKYYKEGTDQKLAKLALWNPTRYCYHVGNVVHKRYKDYTREQLLKLNNFLGFVIRQTVERL